MANVLVGVAGDLVAHHHTVHQPLGQQAGVVVAQLSRGQLPQVLALNTQQGGVSLHNGEEEEEESESTRQRGGGGGVTV